MEPGHQGVSTGSCLAWAMHQGSLWQRQTRGEGRCLLDHPPALKLVTMLWAPAAAELCVDARWHEMKQHFDDTAPPVSKRKQTTRGIEGTPDSAPDAAELREALSLPKPARPGWEASTAKGPRRPRRPDIFVLLACRAASRSRTRCSYCVACRGCSQSACPCPAGTEHVCCFRALQRLPRAWPQLVTNCTSEYPDASIYLILRQSAAGPGLKQQQACRRTHRPCMLIALHLHTATDMTDVPLPLVRF